MVFTTKAGRAPSLGHAERLAKTNIARRFIFDHLLLGRNQNNPFSSLRCRLVLKKNSANG